MDIAKQPTYFLAANSGQGFYSKFSESYDAHDGWKAYVIKGGPGTGKSSLMKYIAQKALILGIKVEICPCSSDPKSLDAVIFPTIKKVILDGTAPHVVEPKYPAVCEQIINLGQFWDETELEGSEKELLKLYAFNSTYHKKASQYIITAGKLISYNFGIELAATDIDKVFAFASRLAKNNIPEKKNKKPSEWVRFLGGITPEGMIFYGNTIDDMDCRKVIISDKYGAVSGIIMSVLRDAALDNGYEIITLKNEILPHDMIDHVIIPELSIAFCRENGQNKFLSDERRIHARRFIDSGELAANRQKLAFNRRVAKELLQSACDNLKKAKAVHDQMERYYIDIMDFEAMNLYALKIADKILSA